MTGQSDINRRSWALCACVALALAACGDRGTAGAPGRRAAPGVSTSESPPARTVAPVTPSRSSALAASSPVEVGLDRLASAAARPLQGRRVGLIANAASVTRAGTPALQALRAHGVRVLRLFTPEHGLSGTAGAGVDQRNGVDPRSGLPVVSLYGDQAEPTATDLAGLDALVFDLQDAGVRFFTYVSTEILAMQSAAEVGIPFVVLDRPDPLGGTLTAGPLADGPKTFVSTAPGPLVYGLTAGEVARYVNARAAKRARLIVVPMLGWRRDMTWAETGRRWIAPSPNLRSPDAALLYPGTALFEGSNVSEGRGTRTPFQTVCAPWLDPSRMIARAASPGVVLTPAAVVPVASAAAPMPKFAGLSCKGVQIGVDSTGVNGFDVGLGLLIAARRAPEFAWLDGGAAFDTLVGTGQLRRALDRGESVGSIVGSETRLTATWRRDRAGALLYR